MKKEFDIQLIRTLEAIKNLRYLLRDIPETKKATLQLLINRLISAVLKDVKTHWGYDIDDIDAEIWKKFR